MVLGGFNIFKRKETDSERLARINEARRLKGRPPLTESTYRQAMQNRSYMGKSTTSDDDFLLNYVVLSTIMNSGSYESPSPDRDATDSGRSDSYYSSTTKDYGSSSSSYDSGGSSYDSGSSSSGGDSGGGGGGE